MSHYKAAGYSMAYKPGTVQHSGIYVAGLSRVKVIPFLVWFSYSNNWYEKYTFFGMLSVKREIIPILVWNSYHCFCCAN